MSTGTPRVSLLFVLSIALFVKMIPTLAVASVFVTKDVSGSLGYDYRMTTHSTGASENRSALRANIDNSFIIWQDWFATGNSDLTFIQQETLNSGSGSSTQSVSGSIGLNLLPQSKVPFSFKYGLYDSTNSPTSAVVAESGAMSDDHVVGQVISVSQGYIGDSFRLDLTLSDNAYDSSRRGEYGSTSLALKGLWRSTNGDLRAVASQSTRSSYDGVDIDTNLFTLNHGYTGFKQFTINTVASDSKIEQVALNTLSGGTYNYSMSSQQVSSNVVWRSQNKKTSLTSNVRYVGMHMLANEPHQDNYQNNKMTSLSTIIGGVHRFTHNLNVNVRMSRLQSNADDAQTETARDRAAISYRSDRISLGPVIYDFRTSFAYRQLRDEKTTDNDADLNFGHAANVSWNLSGKQRVSLRVSQDLLVNASSSSTKESETNQRLGTRAKLDWTQPIAQGRRKAGITISDRRNLHDSKETQVYKIDLSQQQSITNRIRLGGKLNYQMTNNQTANASGGGSTVSSTTSSTISANLSYLSPFSIAGLVFNSDYRFSQSAVAQSADLNSQQIWDNKLVYRVGKLDTSLQYMYREARKTSYNMVYFNVKRVF